MTPRRRDCRSPRPSASGRSPRRRWWPPASAPKWTRAPDPRRPACSGAVSWPGSARRCSPARWARGDSVAVFGCGGVGLRRDRRRPARRGLKGRSASTSTRASSIWPGSSGPPTPSTPSSEDAVEAIRALTDGNGADVCIEAVGNPEVMRTGLLRPGPGRDPRSGGRAHAGHAHRPSDDRVLRARWTAQAQLVRRLPPVARLPDADRPLSAGPARPGPFRVRDHRPRGRRGGLPPDGARRGAPLGRGDRDRDRARDDERASSRSTGRTSRSRTTSGSSGTTARCSSSTPPMTTDPIVDGGRWLGRAVAIVATHGHNDHINAAGALCSVDQVPHPTEWPRPR